MKTYKQHLELNKVPLETNSVIMHLVHYYSRYEIRYSEDLSITYIGDFYLKKLLDSDKTSQHTPHSSTYYNLYEIGYTEQWGGLHSYVDTISMNETPFVFDFIDELDKFCYTEYTNRQERAQLLMSIKETMAAIKSLPRQVIGILGRQRACGGTH